MPKQKRILAIGDIHGCYRALSTLLELIELGEKDLLITLGDYIDRGPDSYLVIETLIRLYEQNRLIPLLGNHEMIMLELCKRGQVTFLDTHDFESKRNLTRYANENTLKINFSSTETKTLITMWRSNGGQATIDSYRRATTAKKAYRPDHHYRFLMANCRNWFETEQYILVHGGVLSHKPLENQSTKHLYSKRTNSQTEPRHCSGKIIVCGHDIQKNGVPTFGQNAICIDTGGCTGGWLSALDLNSGSCWQANQQGQARRFEYGPLPNLEFDSLVKKQITLQ